MARTLIIDWDQKRLTAILHGGAKGAKCQGFSVTTEMVPNPVMAEELGAYLREQAKSRGWQVAGLVALIGRDRLVARELRVPQVSPEEEPELVRLQTARELIDSADEVAIDYHAWTDEADPGQRRVLALALRNELLETYRKLAASAGLRLAGLVPRSAGLAALSERESAEVIVGIGSGWREIALSKGGQVVLSRSLAGTGWALEARRVLASQGLTGTGAAKVRLVGGTEDDLAALGSALAESPPVLDSFPADIEPSGEAPWGAFAALAGVARAMSRKDRIPDFANPKKAPPPSTARAKKLALAGAAAGLLAMTLAGFGWWKLASREDDIAQMRQLLEERKSQNKRMAEEEKKLSALAAWETPVWLEEIVDLACRIPDTKKILVTEILTSPISSVGGVASEFNSRMEIRGIFPEGTGDPKELDRIDAELRKAMPARQYLSKIKKSGNQFTLDVQVRTRSPASYTLVPPAKPKATEGRRGRQGSTDNGRPSDTVNDAEKGSGESGSKSSKATDPMEMDKASQADGKDAGKEAKGVAGESKDKR